LTCCNVSCASWAVWLPIVVSCRETVLKPSARLVAASTSAWRVAVSLGEFVTFCQADQ
jgi:hypothetical protein